MKKIIFREATPTEIEGIVNRWNERVCWQEFRRHVHDFYGPEAVRVDLSYGSEYDDEGGYYRTLEDIDVFDKDDNLIAADDPTRPGFLELITTDYRLACQHKEEPIAEYLATLPTPEQWVQFSAAWRKAWDSLQVGDWDALNALLPEGFNALAFMEDREREQRYNLPTPTSGISSYDLTDAGEPSQTRSLYLMEEHDGEKEADTLSHPVADVSLGE